MSLLADIQDSALEPEYLTTGRRRTSRFAFAVTVLLLGTLFTFAVAQATLDIGQRAAERDELIARIEAERARHAGLLAETEHLSADNRQLAQEALDDPELRSRIAELELLSGARTVRGPGIVITVDDTSGSPGKGHVLDSDLSILANGLRQAGAEAIAVNGRRLTTLTAIRSAGSAITVDYISLSPPYTVEAIGNPRALQARFARTSAASWWQHLTRDYGLSMTIAQPDSGLTLVADPGMSLRHTTTGER